MIGIDPNWKVVAGLLVIGVIGECVGYFVKKAGDRVGIPPPAKPEDLPVDVKPLDWSKWYEMNTGGAWIGRMERPIFFAAFWLQLWALIPAWLVMKTAFYWQGANFIAFPDERPRPEQWEYMMAKRQLGSHHVATSLTGTGANIVVALLGVAIGKWILWW